MLVADRRCGCKMDHEETDLSIARKGFIAQLRSCNALSARFGLTLSESAIRELAVARQNALTEHGRIEPKESAVASIIEEFCDSPYLLQDEYEATLLALTDAFYYFKNACGEALTDDELIKAMRERYDAYDGSVDAVIGTSLEALCRARRLGLEDEVWEEQDIDDE